MFAAVRGERLHKTVVIMRTSSARSHLAHHVGAMDVYRTRTDVQSESDHLILKTVKNTRQDLVFAVRRELPPVR
jgi:hypothetical protein